MSRLRVVIPAIDEADSLPHLLDDLAGQTDALPEIVVVDGGSRDATRDICRARGVRCLASVPGRARQMNLGAAGFDGDWLLFLHADSRLTATHQLAAAIACLDAAGPDSVGHFPLAFIVDGTPARGFLYRFMAAKTASNRALTINGDQGLLIRRTMFEAVGGFDARLAFLEDQRMMAALRGRARAVCLPHRLRTSARRFVAEGPRRRYLLMGLVMTMYLAENERYFSAAPGVYARHGEAEGLALRPFFALAARMLAEARPGETAAGLWRVAGVALGQTWQAALALDVALARQRDGSGPCTRFHDAWLARWIERPLFRCVLFCLLLIAVFGPAWCMRLFRERGASPTIPG